MASIGIVITIPCPGLFFLPFDRNCYILRTLFPSTARAAGSFIAAFTGAASSAFMPIIYISDTYAYENNQGYYYNDCTKSHFFTSLFIVIKTSHLNIWGNLYLTGLYRKSLNKWLLLPAHGRHFGLRGEDMIRVIRGIREIIISPYTASP